MVANIRTSVPADEPDVLALMREFYAGEHLPYDARVAADALRQLWEDASLGRLFLALDGGEPIGYAVLAFGFSLEFRGRDALVDELYVRAPARGEGIGTALLRHVEEVCRSEGVHALHLEVDRANESGRRLYHRLGYVDHDRYLLTRWLDG